MEFYVDNSPVGEGCKGVATLLYNMEAIFRLGLQGCCNPHLDSHLNIYATKFLVVNVDKWKLSTFFACPPLCETWGAGNKKPLTNERSGGV